MTGGACTAASCDVASCNAASCAPGTTVMTGGACAAASRDAALSPFPNLEMQHDERSAEVWMKKVNYFCVIVGGQKGFAREHQNGFYET